MNKLNKYYFLSFAFLPLFQYIFRVFLDKNFLNFFGLIGIIILLINISVKEKLQFPKYLAPLLLLIIYYTIWDIVNGKISELGFFLYFFRNHWFYSFVILILIENTSFDQYSIDRLILIFKVTIAISFLVTLVQLFYDPFFLMPIELKMDFLLRDQYNIRLQSIFGYIAPNEVAYSLIPIVSILIGYYLAKNKSFSLIWIFMAGFIFFGTKTRFIYLNFFIILLQYPYVNGLKVKNFLKILVFGVLFSILLIFVLKSIGFSFEEFIQNRLLSESANTRLLAVEMFVKFFPENPFFGTGIHVGEDLYRAIGGRSSQMHVGYLSHLYEYGIVGTLLLFYFLLSALQMFRRDSQKTLFYGSLFAFAAIFVTNLTLVHFSIYNYGILFAFIFNKFLNEKTLSESIS